MKKVIAICTICLLCIVSIIISYLFYSNNKYILFSIMMVLYGMFFFAIIGLAKYRVYMSSRIIDPKKNLKRNYSKIYLGIQGDELADDNTLDLRGYSRNLYVDSLLVKRYYSFLSLDGTIVLFAGKDKHYINNSWICPLDYPLLHPVTLMENGIKLRKYHMYNPFVGVQFLWLTKFGSKRKGMCSLDKQAASIIEFCKVRNVNIKIV